jgi:DNA-binding beta-propeller fold protein YncE
MVSLRVAGVGLMSLLLGAAPSPTTAGATENGPRGVVVNPDTNVIYAITSSKDTVTAIDGATGAATTIKVGSGPKAVAVNPVTNRAYVICELSGSMSVIDGTT